MKQVVGMQRESADENKWNDGKKQRGLVVGYNQR